MISHLYVIVQRIGKDYTGKFIGIQDQPIGASVYKSVFNFRLYVLAFEIIKIQTYTSSKGQIIH